MKVHIGPYKSWIGPYQIADALCFWAKPVKDECGFESKPGWVHKFGTWLSENKDGSDTWLLKLCQWIANKQQRHIYVKIDRWDTWSMDHTLSLIILPMLKQLHATKQGAPLVDDEDVPDYLKSTSAPKPQEAWDVDDNHFLRWDWVLAEMIWAFEQQADGSDDQFYDHGTRVPGESLQESVDRLKVDRAGLEAWQARKSNGYRLFGKYYEALWD
jgi:hypothetical protein